jgi:hypothetical protein
MSMLVPLPFLQDGDESPYWGWTVYFSATESENRSHSSSVTSRPTEEGVSITDHVFPQPQSIRIQGQITGDDAAEKLELLRHFWKHGGACLYVGRVYLKPVVIESFNDSYNNSISNGFRFSMTLKQVILVDEPDFEGAEFEDWIPPDTPPIPEPVPKIPEADFEADVTTGDAPLTVTFDSSNTDFKNVGGQQWWWWNVGDIHWLDGEEGLQFWGGHKTKMHTYQYPGEYTVSLRVKNAFGIDTETKTNYIKVTGYAPDVRYKRSILDSVVETCSYSDIKYFPRENMYVYYPAYSVKIGDYWKEINPLLYTHTMYVAPYWVVRGYGKPNMFILMFITSYGDVKQMPAVYGTPFIDPITRESDYPALKRWQWILLDPTDTETEVTADNFDKSVKLYLFDSSLVEAT